LTVRPRPAARGNDRHLPSRTSARTACVKRNLPFNFTALSHAITHYPDMPANHLNNRTGAKLDRQRTTRNIASASTTGAGGTAGNAGLATVAEPAASLRRFSL
jgi:hypothetical protein